MNQQEAWEREYNSSKAIPTTTRKRPSSAAQRFEDFLRNNHLKKLSILDLGAGGGRNSIFFAGHDHEITAIDFAEPCLRLLRKRIDDNSLSNKIRIFQHDLNRPLPFKDDSFDASIDITTTTSLTPESMKHLIKELRRVIKPGGYIVSYVHSREDGYLQTVAPSQNHYEVGDTGIIDYAYSEQELRGLYRTWRILDLEHIEKEDTLCGALHMRRLWWLVCRNEK